VSQRFLETIEMASSSKTRLSNSTMSLRFMQRATQEKILPQQAKLLDDSEWQVGQDVLDMWASQRFLGREADEANHESSYLPFVFGDSSPQSSTSFSASGSSTSPKLGGKRVFGRAVPSLPTVASKEQGSSTNGAQPDAEPQDQDEGEEGSPEEHTPARRNPAMPIKQATPQNNSPTRRPGILLSKGARLVQMARESQDRAKPKEPPIPSDSVVASRKGAPFEKVAAGRRRLMRPDVHMPGPVKSESRASEAEKYEGEGEEDELKVKSDDLGTIMGGKTKRRRGTKKVDLMGGRSQKKLKEIH